MEQQSIIAIVGAIGLVLLALSWHFRKSKNPLIAQIGWILVSLYFFAGSWKYYSHNDYVLTIMCMLALPLGIGMSIWEGKVEDGKTKDALIWSRGAMAYAGGPYLLIAHVPWLSVLAIWFVASQVALFYRMSGTGDIHLGETWVQTESGKVNWDSWDGNRWFSTETFGEFPYQTELVAGDGTLIGINFVLACTALQSMVIFIGAISVLDLDWRRRIRALIFTVPVIHILNVFRNVGLIWMHQTYTSWSYFGMSVFEFGHNYASRFVSLFAMFFMALIMFEILPELHRHIVRLLKPLGILQPKSKKIS
ncbi:MAG: archaeosortase A [Candidatus Poseidoniales archaeon]|nr:MAG: archaeosortase A [Candidatus Poseidoniales archaeon]|tara:strand:+ start:358 stop:1278 length:921 start_codon:yes stop_codon:yes gene_type:complete